MAHNGDAVDVHWYCVRNGFQPLHQSFKLTQRRGRWLAQTTVDVETLNTPCRVTGQKTLAITRKFHGIHNRKILLHLVQNQDHEIDEMFDEKTKKQSKLA